MNRCTARVIIRANCGLLKWIYCPRDNYGQLWHLSMKEGSLFVLYWWDPPFWMPQITFLVSLKSSEGGGVHRLWFHGIWTCGAKVLEYWMIFSLKIKLNRNWKFRRNWNVPLVLVERCWWAGFNGIYLVRFGFRMWEILIFKWFLQL